MTDTTMPTNTASVPEAFMPSPGLCLCGCGLPTTVATCSDSSRGHVKGQPVRYRVGHAARVRPVGKKWMSSGYTYMLDQNAAPREKTGARPKRAEHRLIAERALGKRLPKGAVVHHVDGSRSNNHPSNLVVCQDAAYHRLLHQRTAALEASGNPSWRLCSICHTWDAPSAMYLYKKRNATTHRECRAKYNRARRAQGRTV
jgi:hypothetical protein